MTDDMWRRDEERERRPLFDDDDEREPLFADDADRARDEASGSLSFGEGDTGQLPHWTEPPTGEVPRLERAEGHDDPPLDDELDVWSSFTSESPVWRDDVDAAADEHPTRQITGQQPSVTGQQARTTGQHPRATGEVPATREPARITIGTDPSGMPRRAPAPSGRRRGGSRAPSASGPAPSGGRDLPMAVAAGLVLAAVFIGLLLWRPVGVVAFIAVLLGLAAVEFYDKVGEKGYRPAVVPGIAACVLAPVAAYWLGEIALPLVLAFAFMAVAGGFIGARGVEAGPLPNSSITMLGIVWIGMMGAFAALILRFSTVPGDPPFGTDTLFLLALGVVANDVGAYFVGSAAGRTPLREWISPSKTVEGFIGGALFTIVVLVVVGITERSDTWSSTAHLLLLAVVVSIFAPIGDLVESMFKRNLDVKDFGSIIKGHGGVLDRFDGFLFTLPAVYYLTLVLEPWLG